MVYDIGYARVSTKNQNVDMQWDELKQFGCEEIVTEKESGTKKTGLSFNPFLESFEKVTHWLSTS